MTITYTVASKSTGAGENIHVVYTVKPCVVCCRSMASSGHTFAVIFTLVNSSQLHCVIYLDFKVNKSRI